MMCCKKAVLVIFFFSNVLLSQTISGKLTDSKTNEPLPYANLSVLNTKTGTSTNENGEYVLRLKKISLTDTLLISYLGYQSVKFPLSKFKTSNNDELSFSLTENKAQIDEVVLSVKKQKYTSQKHHKIKKKTTKFGTAVQFGMEECVLIKNNKNTKGKVTQVSFYLSENPETSFRCYATYYRVKFYEYDAIKNQPGRLLSYFPHIIHPKGNKKEKITIDLNDHHVLFPVKGICVGIETVNPLPKRKINNLHSTFPSLTWTYDDEPLSWRSFRGQPWFFKKRTLQSSGIFYKRRDNFVNPIIDVVVKYRK